MTKAGATGNWLDFQQLAVTRAASRTTGEGADAARGAALRGAARQFEALFVNMMLKSMREASFGDPLFDDDTSETYRDMLDRQLSLQLSEGGGIGIADMLVRQLSPTVLQATGAQPPADPFQASAPPSALAAPAAPAEPDEPGPPAAVPAAVAAPGRGYRLVSEEGGVRVSALREPGPPASRRALPPALAEQEPFQGPEDFVARTLPHARRVAGQLGVQPEVLVAQAALETGWGQHMMGRAGEGSSHNLFGIKADPRWDGASVSVPTLEFRDGVMRREQARFRAYDSLAESFDDYARFVAGQGRYRDALESARAAGGDGETYIRSLHAAGYATDPDYAEKVLDVMRRTVAAVKNDASRSL